MEGPMLDSFDARLAEASERERSAPDRLDGFGEAAR